MDQKCSDEPEWARSGALVRTHESEPHASGRAASHQNYLLRRWNRVRLSIFLCFFLRMRLRRFLISDPMAVHTVVVRFEPWKSHVRVP